VGNVSHGPLASSRGDKTPPRGSPCSQPTGYADCSRRRGLKACGLYGVPAPHGPTEPEDAVLAEQQCQGERRRAALMAAL